MNINDITDWNYDSLKLLKSLLEDKEKALELISQVGTSIDYDLYKDHDFLLDLYQTVKNLDKKVGLEILAENGIKATKEEYDEVLEEITYINNDHILEYSEERFLTNEELFEKEYSGIPANRILHIVGRLKNQKLKEKLYYKYQKDILKRFTLAGQDESRYLRDILELNVLEEKDIKRAITRMVKMAPSRIPIAKVYGLNIYSQEEIENIAEEMGYDSIIDEDNIPDFLMKKVVEESSTYRLTANFKKIDKELIEKALKRLSFNELMDVLPVLADSHKKKALALIKKEKERPADNGEILKLYEMDKELAIKVLEENIENDSYGIVDYVELPFIKGKNILDIAKNSPRDIEKLSEKVDMLEKFNIVEDFIKIAKEKGPKSSQLNILNNLKNYANKEDIEAMEEKNVESIDGATDYLLNNGKSEKLRKKAIARIAGSSNGLESVLRKAELSENEISKIGDYSSAKKILSENVYLMNLYLEKASTEDIKKIFNKEMVLEYTSEVIEKIDEKTLKEAMTQFSNESFNNWSFKNKITSNKSERLVDLFLSNNLKKVKEEDVFHYKSIINNYSESIIVKLISKEEKYYSKIFNKKQQNLFNNNIDQDKYKDNLEDEELLDYIINNLDSVLDKLNEKNRALTLNKMVFLKGISSFWLTERYKTELEESFVKTFLHDPFFLMERSSYFKEYLSPKNYKKALDLIKSNDELISLAMGNIDEDDLIDDDLSVEEIVRRIENGDIKSGNIPKKICRLLVRTTLRDKREDLLKAIKRQIDIEEIAQDVQNNEEARFLVNEETAHDRFRSRVERVFDILKDYDLKEEIGVFILTARKPSFLLEKYDGRYSLDNYDMSKLFLRAKNESKAELKRVIDFLSKKDSFDLAFSYFEMPYVFEDVVSEAKILKMLSKEKVMELISKPDVDKAYLRGILKHIKDEEVENLAILRALQLKYLTVSVEDGAVKIFLNELHIATDDIDTFVQTHGTDAIRKELKAFAEVYREMYSIVGDFDIKTNKIISSGREFDLSTHDYLIKMENGGDVNEFYAAKSLNLPIKYKAKLNFMGKTLFVVIINQEDDFVLNQKAEDLSKILASLEKKQEEMEMEFSKLLGEINSEKPFGVEMEFNSRIRRDTLAEKIKEKANMKNVEATDQYKGTTGDNWEIKYDSSITVEEKEFSAEVVSPKLYGEEGIKELEKVVNSLVEISKRGTLKTGIEYGCGLHVHHEARDLIEGKENLKSIAEIFYALQEPLYSIVDKSRGNNSYCRKVIFNKEGVEVANRGGFNLISPHKTIEFRMKEGDIDPKSIVRWIRLTKSIVDNLRKTLKDGIIDTKRDLREVFKTSLDAIILEKRLQSRDVEENKSIYEKRLLSEYLMEKISAL